MKSLRQNTEGRIKIICFENEFYASLDVFKTSRDRAEIQKSMVPRGA